MMQLTLPYPVSANRKFYGRQHLTTEARDYLTHAGWVARSQVDAPLSGKVAITVRIYRPRKRGDIDNGLKLMFDALNGIVYEDDKQIVELHVYRHDDKANPRVELSVMEVD